MSRPTFQFCLILIISGMILAAPPKSTTSDQNDRPTVIKYKATFNGELIASAARTINSFMTSLFRYVHIIPHGSMLQEQSTSLQNDSKSPFDVVIEFNHVSVPIASKPRRSAKPDQKAPSNLTDYIIAASDKLVGLVEKVLGPNGDNVRVIRFGTDIVANNNNNNTGN